MLRWGLLFSEISQIGHWVDLGGSGVNYQLQAIGPKLILPQLIWVGVVVPKEQGPQLKTTQKSAMGAAEVQSLSQRKVKVGHWVVGGSVVIEQLSRSASKLNFSRLYMDRVF